MRYPPMNTFEKQTNLIEQDIATAKIKEEVLKKFADYQKSIMMMASDAPIGVLNLPKATESILVSNGILRVYDLFSANFVEIKGLGKTRIRDLTTRLDEFISMF